jgi:hypothetical protein
VLRLWHSCALRGSYRSFVVVYTGHTGLSVCCWLLLLLSRGSHYRGFAISAAGSTSLWRRRRHARTHSCCLLWYRGSGTPVVLAAVCLCCFELQRAGPTMEDASRKRRTFLVNAVAEVSRWPNNGGRTEAFCWFMLPVIPDFWFVGGRGALL